MKSKTVAIFRFAAALICLAWSSGALAAPPDRAGAQADTTPPRIAFSTLRRGQTLTYFRDVFGWVKDNPGGSGVAHVIVRFQRRTHGKVFHWGGYDWWRAQSDTPGMEFNTWYLAEIAGERWRYTYLPSRYIQTGGMGAPMIGPKLVSGTYKFTATAYDRAGNSRSVATVVRVAADTASPTVAFSWPRSGSVVSALPVVKGRARDSGGSGLAHVEMSLFRPNDKRWWNGSAWRPLQANTPPRLPAVLSRGRWQVAKALPTGANLPNGSYKLLAYSYDRAGNRSGLRWFDLGDGGQGVSERAAVADVRVRRKK